MNEFKGFRFGVREVIATAEASLVEAIESELARASVRPSLAPLELIELGAVYVGDERSLNPARIVRAQEKLRIHTSPRRYETPANLRSQIAAETGDYLVVYKPANLPLEAVVDNVSENLISFFEDARGETLFAVQRLELESSGLVVLAKSLAARDAIKKAFAENRVRRTLVAYLENPVPVGQIAAGITVSTCELQVGSTQVINEERESWRIEGEAISRLYRLEAALTSARPLELRIALSALGAPIIGDTKHGSPLMLADNRSGKKSEALIITAITPPPLNVS